MWLDSSAVALGPDRVGQDVEELASGKRIEGGEGLVEQEDRCAGAEREGQRNLRLLAAG